MRPSGRFLGTFGALLSASAFTLGCSDAATSVPSWGQGGAASGVAGAQNGGSNQTGGSSTNGGTNEGGVPGLGGMASPGSGGNLNGNGGSSVSGGSPTTSSGGSNAVGGAPPSAGSPSIGQGGAPRGGGGGASTAGGSKAAGGSSGAGKSGSGGTVGSTGGATGGSGGAVTGDRATAAGVCARWKADRANLSEGTWSGDTASCNVGDISADGRANALRLYNLYRWLGDLPAVATDAVRDRQAQACALMQEANGTLSHTPPMSWKCWTQEGADGSSSSNISGGPGVQSVDAYLIDTGNETTFGHRRWILSNSLGPIGLGSTANGSSCMQNLRGTGKAGKTWMAWPSPGIFPLQAITYGRTSRNVDATGWTIQSDSINLAGAMVSVTANGAAAPVTVSQLAANYGARYAIRILPSGWTSKAGTYAVSVTGIPTPISYQVEVVDCP